MSEVCDALVDALVDVVHTPVFALFVTVAAYALGRRLRDRTGHPLAQPVLVAIAVVGALLVLLDIDYRDYRADVELIAFWLGPATVALAVPLHRQARRLTGYLLPLLVALVAGVVVSVGSGVLIVEALGGSEELARSVAPKSATTPVSIMLAERLDGIGPLAAVFTIMVGLLGATAGPAVLDLLRVRDRRARGLAIGAVSHGIGTSRSLADNEVEGAFAGLSMGITALATGLLLPLLALLLW